MGITNRRRLVAGGLAAAALVATVAPSAVEADGGSSVKVLIDGLSSPKGVALDGWGNVIVGQGAFGAPGPVLRYDTWTLRRDKVSELTEPLNLVDVAVNPHDGSGWGIRGDGMLLHRLADGTIAEVLSIPGYQMTDPDEDDIDPVPNPEESNPYGLAAAPNGDALVADAAGNDIIRVTAEGDAWTVARLVPDVISTEGAPIPLPPEVPSEAVPTSIALGPDGDIFVGELQGFPFTAGTSQVWRIDADAEGAVCSTTAPSGGCSVALDGFTAIQDIAYNPWSGKLYVLELAVGGVLAFENAGEEGPPPAVLYEVTRPGRRGEKRTELAAGQIVAPGGVAVSPLGLVYVTDGIFGPPEGPPPGRLLRVR